MVKKLHFSMDKVVVLLLIFMLVASSGWAGTTGKIAGRVINKATNEPLPGVNVSIIGTNLGAATSINGDYFIVRVPPGRYSVKASMMGTRTVIQEDVRVLIDQTTTINFELEETTIEGEEVTVVAIKPPVEIDLTASKARITAEDLAKSWITEIDEAIVMQSGVNIHGGIRGGFGLDVTYIVDGQELRDGATNSAFVSVPTSSIQEMELLTGGWNAEYPQASSGIINIVTKSVKDKIHANLRYRMRPAGKYHWGRNIYSKQNYEWWEKNPDGSPGYNSIEYWTEHDGGAEPFVSMTPEERLALWRRFITSEPTLTDYANRTDWDIEGSVYGAITSKIGFLVSGRWEEGAPIFPNAFPYNPTWNALAKLEFDFTDNTKFVLSGWGWGTYNGEASVGIWHSSEMVGFRNNPKGWFYSPYNVSKFWPWGGGGSGGGESLGRLRPPEYIRQHSMQGKLTHVFNPSTFLEASLQHYRLYYRSDQTLYTDKGFYMFKEDVGNVLGYPVPNTEFMANGYFGSVGAENDSYFSEAWTNNTNLKVDFTSQINQIHQIKAGASFSSYLVDRERGNNWIGNRQTTVYGTTSFKPWEASLYLQDKIELRGMIINAGLRLDMFDVNKKVNYTITDPSAISDHTFGNQTIGEIGFDPDSRYAVDTPTQYAISPRIGISHPISANTVLHFMYGHFNQRPGWLKIGAQGALTQNVDGEPDPSEHEYTEYETKALVDGVLVRYNHGGVPQNNPALEYEKMIQYEVGFEQNIVDLLSLDVTMYYKDAKDLTSLGFQSGRAIDDFDFATDIKTQMYSDPYRAGA